MIQGPAYSADSEIRWTSIREAAVRLGAPIDPALTVRLARYDLTLEPGREAARALVASGQRFTALFAFNDVTAIGAIQALDDAGLQVPGDVSVIGFDDIPEAEIVRPTLTTIAQNPKLIGERLAQALFERLENPNLGARRIIETPYKFIPRQST